MTNPKQQPLRTRELAAPIGQAVGLVAAVGFVTLLQCWALGKGDRTFLVFGMVMAVISITVFLIMIGGPSKRITDSAAANAEQTRVRNRTAS